MVIKTIKQMLDNLDENKLDLIAFQIKQKDQWENLTFRELQEQVRLLGNALLDMGIKKGDSIGILSENRIEWVLTYLSVTCIGAIIVPLDSMSAPDDLLGFIKTSDCRVVFISGKLMAKCTANQQDIEKQCNIVCLDKLEIEDKRSGKFLYFESLFDTGNRLVMEGADYYSEVIVNPQDTASMIITDKEKVAELSHNGLMSNVFGIYDRIFLESTYCNTGDKWLVTIPFHHTYPTMFGILFPIFTYNTALILTRFKAKDIIHIINEAKINYIATVPVIVEDIHRELISNTVKLKSLKFIMSGGAFLSPVIIESMKKTGVNVVQGYGLTEYSPVVSVNGVDRDHKIGSVGRPLQYVEVKIYQPDSEGNGELWVKGPSIMNGYYKMPEASKEMVDDSGWLHTGDIVRIDEEGYIYITGRCRNIVVTKGGKNIYPKDIIDVLMKSDYIKDIVIIPKPDMQNGESLHAIIQIDLNTIAALEGRQKKRFSDSEIEDFVKADIEKLTLRLPHYKIPKSIDINYEKIVARDYLEKRFMFDDCLSHTDMRNNNTQNEGPVFDRENETSSEKLYSMEKYISQYIVDCISKVLNIESEEIHTDSKFLDVLNSVELVQVSDLLREEVGIELSPTILFECTDIKDLSKYLSKKHKKEFKDYLGEKCVEEEIVKVTEEIQDKRKTDSYDDRKDTESIEKLSLQKAGKDKTDEIAIIGVSGIFPNSENLDEFWKHLEDGDDLIDEIPDHRFDYESDSFALGERKGTLYPKRAGLINDIDRFDSAFFKISPKEAELMDPQQRKFLEVVWKVIENAGYKASDLAGTLTGIFAGVATHDYNAFSHNIENIEAHASTGWAHSVLVNRISYLLDLHGTSEAIDTACSSSLVALQRAVAAINDGDCDMAIVGGVNALISPDMFVCFHKAGMLSPDGRCKTFSKGANGYVRGEGAGAIFLKPMRKALKDGDYVYAVVKSVAVGHGGAASSLTSPNPKGQAKVLVSAYEKAGIPPDTVTYIEAHGTGTELGDPVEIRGLNKAFSQLYGTFNINQKIKNYCGLGSVKTNIGHLETAAGIAGIIKVILAMKHKKIPASINFSELNPYIDLDESPFYIVTESKEWEPLIDEKGKYIPRRAGVSSFGFGGSNSHAVLEEFTNSPKSLNVKNSRVNEDLVFVLSAKNEERLIRYAIKIINFLKKSQLTSEQQDNNDYAHSFLQDFTYTLQVGRESMDDRLAVIVSSMNQLIETLSEYVSGKTEIKNLFTGNIERDKKKARILTKGKAGKEFIQTVIEDRDISSLAELWVSGIEIDWRKLYSGKFPNRVPLPGYPFAGERYWAHESRVGAKRLSMEKGEFSKLHPLIDRNTSNLRSQSFETMLSGEKFYLRDHVIENAKILPGVCYLELARAAGEISCESKVRRLKGIVWAQPISVSENPKKIQTLLYPHEDAIFCEIISYSENDQKKVHFQSRIILENHDEAGQESVSFNVNDIKSKCSVIKLRKDCYREFCTLGFNYGPTFQPVKNIYYNDSEAISSLELHEELSADFDNYILHPSLMDGALHTVLGFISTENGKTDSKNIYLPFSIGEIEIQKPIEKESYVYTIRSDEENTGLFKKFTIYLLNHSGQVSVKIKDFILRAKQEYFDTAKSNISLHYYKPRWQKTIVNKNVESIKEIASVKSILVFSSSEELRDALRSRYENTNIILVKPGNKYKEYKNFVYEINPSIKSNYLKIRDSFRQNNIFPGRIIHAWALHDSGFQSLKLKDRLERSIYSIFNLSKMLMEEKQKTQIQLLYFYGNSENEVIPEHAAISGFAKTIRQENPLFSYKTVEIKASVKKQGSSTLSYLLDIARDEFQLDDAREIEIRYDDRQRFVKKLEKVNLKVKTKHQLSFKDNNVYIITGGAGSIGLIFAKYIAQNVNAKLVLCGRSELSVEKDAKINEIRKLGSEVIYVKADISRKKDVERLVSVVKSNFNGINGIIHSAGLSMDSYLIKKTRKEMEVVLAPKIHGTVYLDEVTKNEDLDFFVLFSSVSGILGNLGQCDYAYGNHFLDIFAEGRELLRKKGERSGKALSINWPLWSNGGIGVDKQIETRLKDKIGMMPLSDENGIKAFKTILKLPDSQVLVIYGDAEKIYSTLLQPQQGLSEPAPNNYGNKKGSLHISTDNEEHIYKKTEQYLTDLLARETKIPANKIKSNEMFEKYGIDSVMIMNLNKALENQFGELSKTLFFEYQNLGELTGYFVKNFESVLRAKFSEKDKTKKSHGYKIDSIENNEVLKSPAKENPKISSASRFINYTNKNTDVAIIGVSGRYPMAKNLTEFWENLKAGMDCITEIPEDRWDHDKYNEYYGSKQKKIGKLYGKWGGFISDVDKFDPMFFNITPAEAKIMDPQERLFLEIVYSAIEDAGYTKSNLVDSDQGRNVGVFVGSMWSEYQLYGGKSLSKDHYDVPSAALWRIANRVSYILNFQGPSITIDTACSSSLTALHMAKESIQKGECQLALAGGINLSLHPDKYITLGRNSFLSSDGRCRSFGQGGDGYVPGEGVGAVVLKPLSKAIKDRDNIYAVIKGSSINHGGKVNGFTKPNPKAHTHLILDALKRSEINPRTISYLEAHGTGTALGDPVEMAGLKNAFEKHTLEGQFCPIGSVKSNIGHLEAAAGMAAVAKVILQMKYRKLVPSIHSETINPNIQFEKTPFYLQKKFEDWKKPKIKYSNGDEKEYQRVAAISSFGAGGSNAHIILEEFKDKNEVERYRISNEQSEQPEIIVLSAKSENRLKEYVKNVKEFVEKNKDLSLKDIAYTLKVGREAFNERLAIVTVSIDELLIKLEEYLNSNKKINGLYAANEKLNNGLDLMIGDTDDATTFISKLFKENQLSKIASFWVTGSVIDWEEMYKNNKVKPKRISLPTYPFAKESYWIGTTKNAIASSQQVNIQEKSQTHPLLDEIVPALDRIIFKKKFYNSESIVRDHVVNHKTIVPAACHIEMAHAAGSIVNKDAIKSIQRIFFYRPCNVGEKAFETEISLSSSQGFVNYKITNENKIYSKGKLFYKGSTEENNNQNFDIDEIKSKCTTQIDKKDIQSYFRTTGLEYGETFSDLNTIWVNGNEALGKINLSPKNQSKYKTYTINPTLLDASLQSVMGFNFKNKKEKALYIPFSIKEIEISNTNINSDVYYAYTKLIKIDDDKSSIYYDIIVLDESIKMMLNIKNLCVKKVSTIK